MTAENPRELIERYFLGTISGDEMLRLDQRLKSDREFRVQFATAARLDTNLRDAAASLPAAEVEMPSVVRCSRRSLIIGLAAAAVIILGAIFVFRIDPATSPEAIAQVSELNGAVTWIADGSQTEDRLEVNAALTGGTLEVSSLNSWAEVVFYDGSSLWISGPAVVTLSDGEAGKVIRVREGDLSLDVTPQASGKPMRIITPSAEAVVVGTRFNISANASLTSLSVNEGRVRVTRLADGSVEEVAANHQVVAGLEQAPQFKAHPRGEHVGIWKSKLPRDARQGDWRPSEVEGVGVLQAKAHLFRGDHGVEIEPILLHSAVVGPALDELPPVLLSKEARFRIVGRLDRSFRINLGFGTNQARGGFSGKFSAERKIDIGPDSDGQFELELSLHDFSRMRDSFPHSASGHELIWFWIQTVEKDVGLELLSVELISSDSPSNQ